jgi:hypothetical protein
MKIKRRYPGAILYKKADINIGFFISNLQIHSNCSKAARSLIPGSIDSYVTGVNVRSQHRCGSKEEAD